MQRGAWRARAAASSPSPRPSRPARVSRAVACTPLRPAGGASCLPRSYASICDCRIAHARKHHERRGVRRAQPHHQRLRLLDARGSPRLDDVDAARLRAPARPVVHTQQRARLRHGQQRRASSSCMTSCCTRSKTSSGRSEHSRNGGLLWCSAACCTRVQARGAVAVLSCAVHPKRYVARAEGGGEQAVNHGRRGPHRRAGGARRARPATTRSRRASRRPGTRPPRRRAPGREGRAARAAMVLGFLRERGSLFRWRLANTATELAPGRSRELRAGRQRSCAWPRSLRWVAGSAAASRAAPAAAASCTNAASIAAFGVQHGRQVQTHRLLDRAGRAARACP